MDHKTTMLLERAQQEAKDMGNMYIGSEHLLLAFAWDTQNPLYDKLRKEHIDYEKIKKDLLVLFGCGKSKEGEVLYSDTVIEILEKGNRMAMERAEEEMDMDCLLSALLGTKECVASQMLDRYEIDCQKLLTALRHSSFCELDEFKELRRLGVDDKGKQIAGREKELQLMISILLRKDKGNPLLVGDAGVGKSALVEHFAWLLEHQMLPELSSSRVYELHLNTLVAGTRYRGDFEEKLQKVLDALMKYPDVILFIDEIHQMIGAGKSEGSIDVSSVLKPYLARGKFRCIGATTMDEYETYMECDRALERRFQLVYMKEPSESETLEMLKKKKKEYEEYHDVNISDDILKYMIEKSAMYLKNRKFPDKAIDVLDLSCVKARFLKKSEISEDMINKVVEEVSGVSISFKNRLLSLQNILDERFVGQDTVKQQILKQARSFSVSMENQPLGLWVLVGEDGTGKDMLATLFAQSFFQQQDYLSIQNEQDTLSVIKKLRRNPNQLLYFPHMEQASTAKISFLRQIMETNQLQQEKECADLTHCLIVLEWNTEEKQNTLDFMKGKCMDRNLSPEVLDLCDEVFYFSVLSKEDKEKIVTKALEKRNMQVNQKDLEVFLNENLTIKEIQKKIRNTFIEG